MNKVIKGKKYDTETAENMGSWSNEGGWNDFNHFEETLYQKSSGEFFLFGEGGANTKYAKRVDLNNWASGTAIIPLNYEAAQEWAEEHLNADDYEKIFGEVTTDDNKKMVSVTLPTALLKKLKRISSQRGISRNSLFETALTAYLDATAEEPEDSASVLTL